MQLIFFEILSLSSYRISVFWIYQMVSLHCHLVCPSTPEFPLMETLNGLCWPTSWVGLCIYYCIVC